MNNAIKPLLRTALTLLFIGSLAAPARADWYLTPYIGAAFGGASTLAPAMGFRVEGVAAIGPGAGESVRGRVTYTVAATAIATIAKSAART